MVSATNAINQHALSSSVICTPQLCMDRQHVGALHSQFLGCPRVLDTCLHNACNACQLSLTQHQGSWSKEAEGNMCMLCAVAPVASDNVDPAAASAAVAEQAAAAAAPATDAGKEAGAAALASMPPSCAM